MTYVKKKLKKFKTGHYFV